MTLFEFLTVAISIVLSFGMVRLLDGVRPALNPARIYSVHAVWVGIKLLNHVLFWWSLWNYQQGVDWNLGRFLWVLLPPALLYLQATALVTRAPNDVEDWKRHFYEIRRWFFGINVALLLVTSLGSYTIGGVPLLHPLRAVQAAMLSVSLIGLVSANERVHAVLAGVALLVMAIGFGGVLFEVGALGRG